MKRSLLFIFLATLAVEGCRRYPPQTVPPAEPQERSSGERPAEARATPAAPDSFVISERAAAIIDSIEAAVRDSFARLRAEQTAELVRGDSIRAAARADSLAAAAALQDSLAAAARRDSIAAAEAARAAAAAAARRDSIEAAAVRDSLAAVARRDSLARVAREDSIAAARIAAATVVPAGEPAADPGTEDLETLRELGPAYIPYDEGPETLWNTETQATLSKTLLPVLRAEGLPATTRTIFWVLISREGRAVETRIQTGSGSAAFDEAAESFLLGLTFIPAIRANRAVASWVLREISMLMQ